MKSDELTEDFLHQLIDMHLTGIKLGYEIEVKDW